MPNSTIPRSRFISYSYLRRECGYPAAVACRVSGIESRLDRLQSIWSFEPLTPEQRSLVWAGIELAQADLNGILSGGAA